MFTAQDMSDVRSRLLIREPFYGMLAMNMKMVEDSTIDTACTDGTEVRYNPTFMDGLTPAEREGLLAHEVMHPALQHLFRRDGREMRPWNEAADYALNPLLLDAGFVLPKGALVDQKYANMAAEEIFSIRESEKERKEKQQQNQQPNQQGQNGNNQQQGQGSGQGKLSQQQGQQSGKSGKPGTQGASAGNNDAKGLGNDATGRFTDPAEPTKGTGNEPSTQPLTATDWKIITEQAAAVANKAGKIAGSMLEQVRLSHQSQMDWKGILQQFVANNVPSDTSWSRPNRRFIAQGVYLPGTVKENVGEIVVLIDSSGSCTRSMQEEFAVELTDILHTARPEKLHVVYIDTQVRKENVYTPEENDKVDIDVPGRGGTRFQPGFDWVEKKGVTPLCAIYLTDLKCSDSPKEPGYPVLWIVPAHIKGKGLFGDTIRIPAR